MDNLQAYYSFGHGSWRGSISVHWTGIHSNFNSEVHFNPGISTGIEKRIWTKFEERSLTDFHRSSHQFQTKLCTRCFILLICTKFGPVPSKDMQTPPPPSLRSGHIYMKGRTVLNRMKNHISAFSDFYFLNYGWLYLQLTVKHQVCHRPKKRLLEEKK